MISCRILLRKRNISAIIFKKNQNTHFIYKNVHSGNRVVYGIMWKHVVQTDTEHMIT